MNQILNNTLKICGVFFAATTLLAIFWFFNKLIGRPLGGFTLRVMSMVPAGRETREALERNPNPSVLDDAKTGIGAIFGLLFCCFAVLFELEAASRKGSGTSEGFRMLEFTVLAAAIVRGSLESMFALGLIAALLKALGLS